MSVTPSFIGLHAVILHRPGDAANRLTRQLNVLGLRVSVQWAPLDLDRTPAHLAIVDADAGWTGILPWTLEKSHVPLVALLGSEAPGRIAWALDHGATALIAKPVAASAVYPALVMAFRFHAEAQRTAETLAQLEERIRLRPLVLGAVQALRRQLGLDEAAAYRHLRQEAMRRRITLESVSAEILAEPSAIRAAI